MIAVCQVAPYGKGTQTLVNTKVRNTFELDPQQFRLGDAWNSVLADAPRTVAEQLGLPADRLEARLYKLPVYEKGGFFLSHRDSEKQNRMMASLIAGEAARSLAEAGATQELALARLRKLRKKPNGPFRVLHAAAAMRARRQMSAAARKRYQTAYNYLRTRTQHMQYAEFRRQGLPIGSGVTEAACKTVFTQRLKLSGMRWSRKGAQVILNLRVILLSGIWHNTYRAALQTSKQVLPQTRTTFTTQHQRKAA